MNRLLIVLLALMIVVSCKEKDRSAENVGIKPDSAKIDKDNKSLNNSKIISEDFKCSEIGFKTVQEQADSLTKFFHQANAVKQKERRLYDKKFFCAFPNSFNEMKILFGFDRIDGEGLLYGYPLGEKIIMYFGNLSSIPKAVYYEKFINICVDGNWEADNIREAFGFHHRLINDTEAVCHSLEKRTDQEIKSVFRFIFDGPHPKNDSNREIYENLLSKMTNQNSRLSDLLTDSYNELMEKDDGHGH